MEYGKRETEISNIRWINEPQPAWYIWGNISQRVVHASPTPEESPGSLLKMHITGHHLIYSFKNVVGRAWGFCTFDMLLEWFWCSLKLRTFRDTCTPMFIAALFIMARTWKHVLDADEWIRKLWYIYTMEYYSAIKKNTFESILMRWMKLELIIQSEVSQKEKYQYSILTHIYGI